MGASALSALLGFGLQIIVAHYYGTRSEMDAFLNASTIPTLLFDVLSGALVGALVPTFSEYISLGREDEARTLGSTVINVLFFLMIGLAALGWLLAPIFVPLIAHGFPADEQKLVVRIVRWLLPGIIATSIAGVCAALLETSHRFLAPALTFPAANIVMIALVVTFHRELGIFALVLGSVLGLFAHLLVQLPAILRHRLYSFTIDLHHPGLAKIWALLVPTAVGTGAAQINLAFDRYFASTLSAGSTAALGYTTKLAYLPNLIVTGAIGTVIFPLIAHHFALLNRTAIERSVSLALRMVSFIVIPAAAGLSVLSHPIVQTLFERGAFGPASTALCSSLVPFACLPLIALAYNSVLGRACYACKQVRLAVVGSSSTVAINIVLSASWLPNLGARGLLLANGVAGLLLTTFFVALLWRLIGGFEWKPILSSLWRIVLAALAMAVTLHVLSMRFDSAATFAARICYLLVLVTVGVCIFGVAARALGIPELSITTSTVMQKFKRRIVDKSISTSGQNV